MCKYTTQKCISNAHKSRDIKDNALATILLQFLNDISLLSKAVALDHGAPTPADAHKPPEGMFGQTS